MSRAWSPSWPRPRTGAATIILWWEARRIRYNVLIAVTGCVSLVLFFVFITASGVLQPGEDAVEPMALFAAPFVINVLYTMGWIVEVLLWLVGVRNPKIGPFLLRVGVLLSLVVVALPTVFWCVKWLLSLIGIKP